MGCVVSTWRVTHLRGRVQLGEPEESHEHDASKELECGDEPGVGEDVKGALIEEVEHDVEGVPAPSAPNMSDCFKFMPLFSISFVE